MKSENLFYPVQRATVGGYTMQKGISIEVFSSKKYLYDWARIRFTRQFNGNIALSRGAAAEIEMGYDGKLQTIFRGVVAREYNKANYEDEILVKDYTLKLEETMISGTYLDVTPQELVQLGLSRAGISSVKLSPQSYPVKKKVAVREKSVLDFLTQIDSLWGIRTVKSFLLGTFYWDVKPIQSSMYIFEYGNNIISLERQQSLWKLTTVAVPAIQHSCKIGIVHPEISGTFEVSKIIFSSDDRGFMRAMIYFEV